MTYNEFEDLKLCQGDYILVTHEYGEFPNGRIIRTTESFELLGKGAECFSVGEDDTIVVEERIGTGTKKIKLKNIKEIRRIA